MIGRDRMGLADTLNRLGPVDVDGVPHDLWLLVLRVEPRSGGSLVEVKVAARNPAGRHYIGRFHIETGRLHDEGAVRARETMERVISGNLPPTAPPLLFF